MRSWVLILACILLSLALASNAFGEGSSYRSKLGVEIKGLRTNVNERIGWLAGLRVNRFMGKSNVHVGLAGYFGVPRGTDPAQDSMYYGGVIFGWDGEVNRHLRFELGIVAGYGKGQMTTLANSVYETSYLVFEPSVGIGFHLNQGWRCLFTLSFLYMADAERFSGITVGVRFDRKTLTSIKPVDN